MSQTPGRLHPAEVFRALRLTSSAIPETVLICDGGEFAQWGQSMLPARRRMINGVAGAIGCSLPFALAARSSSLRRRCSPCSATARIGFHLAEFETAARRNLPFVAVVGNDARWNAESQIQLREYGRNRMHGCELTPARYDLAVAALGGHGELVESEAELPARSNGRLRAASRPAST